MSDFDFDAAILESMKESMSDFDFAAAILKSGKESKNSDTIQNRVDILLVSLRSAFQLIPSFADVFNPPNNGNCLQECAVHFACGLVNSEETWLDDAFQQFREACAVSAHPPGFQRNLMSKSGVVSDENMFNAASIVLGVKLRVLVICVLPFHDANNSAFLTTYHPNNESSGDTVMDIVVFASSSAPHCVLIKWHGISPSDDVLKSALAIMSPEIVLRNAYTLEDIVPTSSFIGPRNFTMSTNEIVNLASFDHEMETPILVDLADEQGVTANPC